MSERMVEIGAAYIRVSTDEQTELSPDAQLRVILEAAAKDGVVIPPEFVFMEGRGRSGRRADNRPEFQRMISTAKQSPSPFRCLYLWKFSRFARNQEESAFYKGILRKKCGVTIKSVSEPIMDGMFGRLVEMIIEWSDEFYSVNLSGEVARGMTQKALEHGYQASPCLGYDAVGGGKPFVINEGQYKIVEFIHRSFYEGMDLLAIARAANALGFRTRRGNPFDRRAVRNILSNSFYIGLVKWQDIVFQGSHECRESVTSVFPANQERLQKEYRPKGRREASSCRHWLSGLLKCAVCGASLSFNRSNSPRRQDFFQCWKYAKGIHPGSCSISARRAEQAVLKSLKMAMETGEAEYTYVRQASEWKAAGSAAARFLLGRLEAKEQRIREAYENGIDTIEEFRQNKERLQKEREKLLEEKKRLEGQGQAEEQGQAERQGQAEGNCPGKGLPLEHIRTVRELLQSPDVDAESKGNALRRVLREAVYDSRDKTLRFYYYIDKDGANIHGG